jgi:hypothetical protein
MTIRLMYLRMFLKHLCTEQVCNMKKDTEHIHQQYKLPFQRNAQTVTSFIILFLDILHNNMF